MRTKAGLLLGTAMVAASQLSGCVTRGPYPAGWAAPEPAPASDCPRIEGRYANSGSLASGADSQICQSLGDSRRSLHWACDTSLASNLTGIEATDWVELRQPDADTLIVVSSDPSVDPAELHRSNGDFSCGPEGLTRKQYASATSVGDASGHPSAGLTIFNGFRFALGALTLSGGVTTLTRTYNPAGDSSLVMAISLTDTFLYMAIPFHVADETFVRWERWVPKPETPTEPTATPPDQSGPPATRSCDTLEDCAPFLDRVEPAKR
jgi:hypothetical protein